MFWEAFQFDIVIAIGHSCFDQSVWQNNSKPVGKSQRDHSSEVKDADKAVEPRYGSRFCLDAMAIKTWPKSVGICVNDKTTTNDGQTM